MRSTTRLLSKMIIIITRLIILLILLLLIIIIIITIIRIIKIKKIMLKFTRQPGGQSENMPPHVSKLSINRHLPFLDLNVFRGVQGNLEISVYRKPTHTDKYLAFDPHHPICHKKSVAKTLLRRTDCLPSSLDSKAFSVTSKNQLQLVTLLMKGNQRLVLLLLLTFRVLRNPSREF